MTGPLEQLTTEVRKLTPTELGELRLWLDGYRPTQPLPTVPERSTEEIRAHWAKHFEEVEKAWGGRPPLTENIVLAERRGA